MVDSDLAATVQSTVVDNGTTTQNLSILVVDDDESALTVMRASAGDARVATARSVMEARTLAEASAAAGARSTDGGGCADPRLFNGFVVDVGLPDGDGRELARAIREIPAFKSAAVLGVTGDNVTATEEIEALRGPFDDFVRKPFSPRVVWHRLARIIELRETQRELRSQKALFESIIETVPIPLTLTDRDGVYRIVNSAYSKLVGSTRGALVGSRAEGHASADSSPHHRDRLLGQKRSQVYEGPFIDGEGKTHDVIYYEAPHLIDDRAVGLVTAIADVTDLRRLSVELARRRRIAEHRAVAMTHALSEAPLQEILPELLEGGAAAARAIGALFGPCEPGDPVAPVGSAGASRRGGDHLVVELGASLRDEGSGSSAAGHAEPDGGYPHAPEGSAYRPQRVDLRDAEGRARSFLAVRLTTGLERGAALAFEIGDDEDPSAPEVLADLAAILSVPLRRERTKRDLQRSEDRYRQMFDGIGEGVIVHDPDGTVVDVNPAAEAIFRAPPGGLIGRHPSNLVHPDEVGVTREAFRELADGLSARGVMRILRFDGTEGYVEIEGKTMENGQIIGLHRDVTDRVASEHRVRLLEAGIAGSATTVIILNNRGEIEYANEAAHIAFGAPRDSFVGRPLPWELVTEPAVTEDIQRAVAAGTTWTGEVPIRRFDDAEAYLGARVTTVGGEYGRSASYVIVAEDITARKRLERSQANAERVTHHDLRNPLASIIALAEVMKDDETTIEEAHDYARMMSAAARRMLDLLTLSRTLGELEAGLYAPTLSRVDLQKTVAEVAETISANVPVVRIDVAISGQEAVVHGDKTLIYHSLFNLLQNAVEADPAGSVSIEIAEDVDVCAVSIHNRSPVPAGIRERFFDKYVTSGKSHGTGLGTYSVRMMTDIQNGSVDLQTSDSEGTTVYLQLPRWRPGDSA